MAKKKKGKIVLTRKKAVILFGSVIGIALIGWIVLMVKIFGGKEKGSLGNKMDKSGVIRFDSRTNHCVKKYSVEDEKRMLVECTEYDRKDNLIKRTVIREGYPNEIFIYRYTDDGEPESGTYQFGDTKGSFEVLFDKKGRKQRQEWKEYPVKDGYLSTGSELFEYDSNGNVTIDDKRIRHLNRSTGVKQLEYVKHTTQYDPDNRLILDKTETSDAERVTDMESSEFTYWENGKAQSRIDRKVGYQNFKEYYRLETYNDQNGYLSHTECYEYDALKRVTKMHNGKIVIYDIDAKGEHEFGYITNRYDEFGRLIEKFEDNGSFSVREEYTYDEQGRMTSELHYSGYHEAEYYDAMEGTSVQYTYKGPNGECTEEIHMRKGFDYMSGIHHVFTESTVSYEYDDKGHKTAKKVYHREPEDAETWEWEYNAKGKLIRESYTGRYTEIIEWEYE